MKLNSAIGVVGFTLLSGVVFADEHKTVSDETISEQRHELVEHTEGKGFGPQAP